MNPQRFELALERLGPGDWERFEKFSSRFLVSEFPNIRTTASPSGDKGRDATLFSPQGDASVIIQYSVTKYWERKIEDTIKQIQTAFPASSVFVYMSNQVIGAKADTLRQKVRAMYKFYLDVRDRNWYVERLHVDDHREILAEQLACAVVDPFLASKEVISTKATALSSFEQQAALVYLDLQWEDDTREKGLTKLCFDALVRSALRGTDPAHALSRSGIRKHVCALLPTHPSNQVDIYTDAALHRLAKRRTLRHDMASDTFALTREEKKRSDDRLIALQQRDDVFQSRLRHQTKEFLFDTDILASSSVQDFLDDLEKRVRRVLERFLLGRGELFAIAVTSGSYHPLGLHDLRETVVRDIGEHPLPSGLGGAAVDAVAEAVRDLLINPTEVTKYHLRRLADAYTLFAFLRETPDVQKAVVKMFSHGEVWLDASVILPLLAEDLLEEEKRQFSEMLRAAGNAGIGLRITDGIVEEVVAHMRKAEMCARYDPTRWQGPIPFLYSAYLLSGLEPSGFNSWLETFRGEVRPQDDIRDYLMERFAVERRDLVEEANRAPVELRGAIQEAWYEAKRDRSRLESQTDDSKLRMLVKHDVENYLGIVELRKQEDSSPFGYRCWWLTLDRIGFDVERKLSERLDWKPSDSPILSPDFLVNYLLFGPQRRMVSKTTESHLPIMVDPDLVDYAPSDLLEEAQRIRQITAGLPDNIIRRRVRDGLDRAKRRYRRLARAGA